MGYDTHYEIKRVAGDRDRFLAALYDVMGGEVDWDEPMRWYEHEDEVEEAMIAAGIAEVDLHGEGEEQGDVWDTEFRLVSGSVEIKTFKYKLVRDTEPS